MGYDVPKAAFNEAENGNARGAKLELGHLGRINTRHGGDGERIASLEEEDDGYASVDTRLVGAVAVNCAQNPR